MTESLEHLENCPTCGVSIDTSAFEPLSQVSCPECGGAMTVGQFIAHYELIQAVGRGGMGVVYKAKDTSLNRFVALKVLRKDHSQHAEFIAQLETEAAITASINHPHVVRVFTTGTDAGRFYIAMELVDKGTLDDLIGLQGQVAEAQVLEIAIQIAQGLRAAYQHGLIHRDVKPGNILFSDAHTAKIVDFGLAMLEAAAQGGGEVWGTPYYVAPEKLDRKPEDFRSDMYSLGATLFHALAGRPPYEADDASMVALKHLKSQAVSLQAFAPHISSSTAYVINRTLAKDPNERYQSYDEFIEHLEYAKSELENKGNKPLTKRRVVLETEADQKVMSYVTFGMLGLAALLGLGGWWYFHSKKTNTAPPPTVNVPTPSAKKAPKRFADVDARTNAQFDGARELLIKGQFAEASEIFRTLGSDRKTPPPVGEWSVINWGLSELLAGKEVESRKAFFTLLGRQQSAEVFKKDNLGKTIRQLAELASKDDPAPEKTIEMFSDSKAGAMAYLVLGVKNWLAGEYETGGSLLRQYGRSDFKDEHAWMGEYEPLIANYLADFTEYRGLAEVIKTVNSKEDEDRILEAITKAREGLHTKGKLEEKFDEMANELKAKADLRRKEVAKRRETDLGVMEKARNEIVEASKAWKFKEAREIAIQAEFATEEMRRERAAMVLQLELLQDWKAATVAELNANLAKAVLKKRDGTDLKNLAKATDDGVEIKGAAAVSWPDIVPETVVAATANLLKPELSSDVLAGRRWRLGAFASMVGMKGAPQLLLSSLELDPSRASDLPLVSPVFRAAGDNLAKGKTATASGSVKTEQVDETPGKALDGDPKTKWCAKEGGAKWFAVDLGEPAKITRWVVHHASAGGEPAEMNTVDFELQSSENGQDWKTVDKVTGNTADVTARSVPVFSARHVRVSISKPNSRPNDPTARIVDFAVQPPSKRVNDPDPVKNFFQTDGWFPAPKLTSLNIGKVDQRGSTQLSDRAGEFSVRASGEDIWKTADSFRFTHRKLKGDGEIIARVSSIENVHEWVKAGLMFRENLTPESPNALFALTPARKITLQVRGKAATETTSQQAEAPRGAPLWLKLTRQGSKFTAYTSEDGYKWTEFKSTTVEMPPEVYIGLALTSHTNSRVTLGKFDFVSIDGKSTDKATATPTVPRS